MSEKTPSELLRHLDPTVVADLPLHYASASPDSQSAVEILGCVESRFHRTRAYQVVPFYKPLSKALPAAPRSRTE
jgi:hypothetical protein